MTENDYLNPSDIKAQCDAAIMRLERDNEALTTVENALEVFINDEEIKSEAYDALKQQISDYKTLLQAMQDANYSDMSDFAVLKSSVGDEVLDGANILAQKQAAWDARICDESAAEGYRRASYTAEWPWVSWYYGWMADHYDQMVQIDIQLYNAWQAKEDAFDAIEASTKNLFQCSAQLRQTAQNGLQSITGAFSNGVYVPDMNAAWRTDLTACYIERMFNEDANGTIVINWTEVEKVLKKEASEITDVEYQTLAFIYLKADEQGMARFLAYCMDRKADIDTPWYNEVFGPSAGLVNQDYTEWVVNESKIGRIQAEIVAKSEELLGQMKIANSKKNESLYILLKDNRDLVMQRLTLLGVVTELGNFRGDYHNTNPMISITVGEKREIVITFNEFRNIGSDYAPTMSNLAESTVTIDYTMNGDSIPKEIPKDAELAFKAYFCNYSAEKNIAEFAYDKMTGKVISQGSKKISEYVGETLGKESLGKIVGTVPLVGDFVGLGVDIALEEAKQEKAMAFIEGQMDRIEKADIYSDFDCSTNFVQYDTAENAGYTLYAYGGEETSERAERVNVLFLEELGKGIIQEDIFENPNDVFDMYKELVNKDVRNAARYDEAINDK